MMCQLLGQVDSGLATMCKPMVWRMQGPQDVVELYQTEKLTYPNLEKAAVVLQHLVIQ